MATPHGARQPQNGGCRSLPLSGHVGFDSLPDQLVNKCIKQGFSFNILCIGETGTGKSTLIDSLFNTTFDDPVSTHFQPNVRLRARTYDLQESNVHLKLTIVNTVGFGDQINKEDSYQPIVDYIDAQFEAYLQEELKIKRSLHSYHDTRIHACLYFISPTGHSLKTLDLLTMKSLDSKFTIKCLGLLEVSRIYLDMKQFSSTMRKFMMVTEEANAMKKNNSPHVAFPKIDSVNIIPIIGKADSISKTELQRFKVKLMSELVTNGVQIYQFPTDDETVSKINAIMNGHLPFAVVGSTEEVKVGNKMVKARQYPWGIVQVENENHCDFVKLREMLICTNMEDLREQTHARHYELYRRCRLEEMGFRDTSPENKPVRHPCPISYTDRKTVCRTYASLERLGFPQWTKQYPGDLFTFLDFSLQEAYEAKRHEVYVEMQRKEEEMRQTFVQRVKEKETILKEAEQEIQTRFEHLKRLHQEEKLKLERNRRSLEDEMALFVKKKAAAELLQTQTLLSTPISFKKDKDRKKDQGFRLELLCFDVRDEEVVNVHEQSEREKLERERNSPREFQK